MPRETFEKELQRLEDEMVALGSKVEQALSLSVDILERQDIIGAQKLMQNDRSLNERRFSIENDALILIATQQPLAGDLRTIAALFEIATELERMADYAKGIAKIAVMIGDDPDSKPPAHLQRMVGIVTDMLHKALDAFVTRDTNLARSIPAQDDQVDDLYNTVYRELMSQILQDPNKIEQANSLLWAAHNLERAADRVINICERVVFTVTGEMEELNGSEVESSGLEGLG